MTFFESVTETIKSTAKNLSDSLHHSAAVSRIKMMITKEEKILNKELAALGTACFEQHKNPQAEADFSDRFAEIEKIQSRVVALQMKLHELHTQRAEQASANAAGGEPAAESPAPVQEPTEGALEVEEASPEEKPEEKSESIEEKSETAAEPAEEIEDNPQADQFREETISQLVDVVAEEAGSPDYDSDGAALDQEIVSRNQKSAEPDDEPV